MESYIINKSSIPDIKDVSGFKIKLFEHQVLLSNYLHKFEEELVAFKKVLVKPIAGIDMKITIPKPILCISDPVGSGKSYSTLSFIKLSQQTKKNITHLVVSFKLIKQWVDYLNNTDLNYMIVTTSKQLNIYLNNFDNDNDYDLILFSDMFYKHNKKIPFRLILDEPDKLHYPKTYKFIISHCEHIYFISSTMEFKYYFKEHIIKISCENINIPEIPDPKKIKYKAINCLQLFEKLNVQDINIMKNVELNNFENSSDLIHHIFKHKTKALKKLINSKQDETSEDKIKEMEKEIDCLESQIKTIKERLLTNTCIICLNDNVQDDKKTVLTCCCIVLCDDCASKINKCVYCKTSKVFTDLNVILKCKLEKLSDINFNSESKIIILGNEQQIKEEHLNNLAKTWFSPKETQILKLKGHTNTCNKRLFEFKNDPEKHIMYFPFMKDVAGFNMEFVTDIILLGNISKEDYTQIVGRAQRLNRTTQLVIHSFEETKNK